MGVSPADDSGSAAISLPINDLRRKKRSSASAGRARRLPASAAIRIIFFHPQGLSSRETNRRRPMGSVSAASRRMIAGYAPPDAGMPDHLQSVCQSRRVGAPRHLGCKDFLTTK
jgi:hypothetical protein